ncbi:MAG TPA: divalent-cation tolerance protein CutA [Chloroflexia bacterium]|jgi:periplasmic divalent cation tolerance protein
MDAQVQANDPLVMLYVPCGGESEATQIASRLLAERLIACANIYASRSLYRWKGDTADEQEHVLICKTLASRSEAAVALIKSLHSYEVPCLLTVITAQANDEFYLWARSEVTGLTASDAT